MLNDTGVLGAHQGLMKVNQSDISNIAYVLIQQLSTIRKRCLYRFLQRKISCLISDHIFGTVLPVRCNQKLNIVSRTNYKHHQTQYMYTGPSQQHYGPRANQCTGDYAYRTTHRNKSVNVDKIKHIFIVLICPTKPVFKHLKTCCTQHA